MNAKGELMSRCGRLLQMFLIVFQLQLYFDQIRSMKRPCDVPSSGLLNGNF